MQTNRLSDRAGFEEKQVCLCGICDVLFLPLSHVVISGKERERWRERGRERGSERKSDCDSVVTALPGAR